MKRNYYKLFIILAALELITAVGEFIRAFQVDSLDRVIYIGLGAVLLVCSGGFIFLYRFFAGLAHTGLRDEGQADQGDRELPKLAQRQPQPKEARED